MRKEGIVVVGVRERRWIAQTGILRIGCGRLRYEDYREICLRCMNATRDVSASQDLEFVQSFGS